MIVNHGLFYDDDINILYIMLYRYIGHLVLNINLLFKLRISCISIGNYLGSSESSASNVFICF